MTTQPAETTPDTPGRYGAQDYDVFRYYIQQQKRDPAFLDTLADKLWEGLSSEEQVVRTILNASFFPDDIDDRQRSIKVGLLRDYIDAQIRLVHQLDADLGASFTPTTSPEHSSG